MKQISLSVDGKSLTQMNTVTHVGFERPLMEVVEKLGPSEDTTLAW